MESEQEIRMDLFERTITECIGHMDFKKAISTEKKLTIKYGVDVTAPFLHIGHAVNLWLMRYLQELGHKVVFLIGDFTTRIGDPTGKSETRPVISQELIEENASAFIRQTTEVLLTDSECFEVRRNSEWFGTMPASKFLELLSIVTHAKLVKRDMFQSRIENGDDIHMHEFLYPVLQGYDSYALGSDLTIVGSDQLFNEDFGRFYQTHFGQRSQSIWCTRITPGTDGKEKQSKSIGNYIAITDSPKNKFGKTMSIPDELLRSYFECYTNLSEQKISQAMGQTNPRDSKLKLAHAIVERYHGAEEADLEFEEFLKLFSLKGKPKDISQIRVSSNSNVLEIILACTGLKNSEVKRLLDQGAVRLNDEKLTVDPYSMIHISTGDLIKVGKRRWFELVIE